MVFAKSVKGGRREAFLPGSPKPKNAAPLNDAGKPNLILHCDPPAGDVQDKSRDKPASRVR